MAPFWKTWDLTRWSASMFLLSSVFRWWNTLGMLRAVAILHHFSSSKQGVHYNAKQRLPLDIAKHASLLTKTQIKGTKKHSTDRYSRYTKYTALALCNRCNIAKPIYVLECSSHHSIVLLYTTKTFHEILNKHTILHRCFFSRSTSKAESIKNRHIRLNYQINTTKCENSP